MYIYDVPKVNTAIQYMFVYGSINRCTILTSLNGQPNSMNSVIQYSVIHEPRVTGTDWILHTVTHICQLVSHTHIHGERLCDIYYAIGSQIHLGTALLLPL